MAYFVKRFANSLLLLLLTVSFVFLAGRLIGDPALNMLGPGASEVALNNLRRAAGLNDPLWQQYVRYVGQLLQGDFGVSYRFGFSVLPSEKLDEIGQPVIGIVLDRLPATFVLAGVAMGLAVPAGVVMGIVAAAYPRSIADRTVTVIALAGVSIVQFWLGLMLIVFFAVQLGWLPTGGYGSPAHVLLPRIDAGGPAGRPNCPNCPQRDAGGIVQTVHCHGAGKGHPGDAGRLSPCAQECGRSDPDDDR